MSVPDCLDGQLSLPLIAAPMFLASGPDLIVPVVKPGLSAPSCKISAP